MNSMEEETYTPEFSNLPDMGTLLQRRIAQQKAAEGHRVTAISPVSGACDPPFDPRQLMVKRHKVETGEELPDLPESPIWPKEDVQALEDYCRKMGIVGFSTRQNPKFALMRLKQQMGDFSDIPLENRVPIGYEKTGAPNSNNCNFPYSKLRIKKSLLCG